MSYTSMVLSNGPSGHQHQHVYTQHRGPYNQQQQQHITHIQPSSHPSSSAHPSAASNSSNSSATASASPVIANQPLLPTVSLSSLLTPTLTHPPGASTFSSYPPPAADVVDSCTRYFAASRTRELTGHRKSIRCVRWNATGTKLASGSGDSTVRVYTLQAATSPATGVVLQSAEGLELKGHNGSAEFVCFNPSRPDQLASASLDGTVKIWDTNCQHPSLHTCHTLALPPSH